MQFSFNGIAIVIFKDHYIFSFWYIPNIMHQITNLWKFGLNFGHQKCKSRPLNWQKNAVVVQFACFQMKRALQAWIILIFGWDLFLKNYLLQRAPFLKILLSVLHCSLPCYFLLVIITNSVQGLLNISLYNWYCKHSIFLVNYSNHCLQIRPSKYYDIKGEDIQLYSWWNTCNVEVVVDFRGVSECVLQQ